MTEQTSDFLRKCLRAQAERSDELRAEVASLKTSNLWLAFSGITGWAAVIVICATVWS